MTEFHFNGKSKSEFLFGLYFAILLLSLAPQFIQIIALQKSIYYSTFLFHIKLSYWIFCSYFSIFFYFTYLFSLFLPYLYSCSLFLFCSIFFFSYENHHNYCSYYYEYYYHDNYLITGITNIFKCITIII